MPANAAVVLDIDLGGHVVEQIGALYAYRPSRPTDPSGRRTEEWIVALRAWCRTRVAWLVVAVCALAWTSPGAVAASAAWQLTASPTTIAAGQEATIELHLTDTEGSGDIACAQIAIGAEFGVVGLGVRGTSAPSPWTVEAAGVAPMTVSVRNADGNGKLKVGDWVDFYLTVVSHAPGDHPWTANALQNSDCTGDPFVEPIVFVITASSAAPATPPVGAEPIAPPPPAPGTAVTPAPTFAFTSRAEQLDAAGAERTAAPTPRPIPDVAEDERASADAAGPTDDPRPSDLREGDTRAGTGIAALIALLAIVGAVTIHWLLGLLRRRPGH